MKKLFLVLGLVAISSLNACSSSCGNRSTASTDTDETYRPMNSEIHRGE